MKERSEGGREGEGLTSCGGSSSNSSLAPTSSIFNCWRKSMALAPPEGSPGGREGGREEGKEGGRKEGKEGGREGWSVLYS